MSMTMAWNITYKCCKIKMSWNAEKRINYCINLFINSLLWDGDVFSLAFDCSFTIEKFPLFYDAILC